MSTARGLKVIKNNVNKNTDPKSLKFLPPYFKARPIFTKFFVHVTYGCGSVLLWRHSGTFISGFVNDVIFASRRQAEAVRLTRMQPWAWRVGIPVAGSGRLGLLLAVTAY